MAATNGLRTPTAKSPIASAAATGVTRNRSPDRPAARTTTSSDDHASARNSATNPMIRISGRMRYSVSGTFSTDSRNASASPAREPDSFRIC